MVDLDERLEFLNSWTTRKVLGAMFGYVLERISHGTGMIRTTRKEEVHRWARLGFDKKTKDIVHKLRPGVKHKDRLLLIVDQKKHPNYDH